MDLRSFWVFLGFSQFVHSNAELIPQDRLLPHPKFSSLPALFVGRSIRLSTLFFLRSHRPFSYSANLEICYIPPTVIIRFGLCESWITQATSHLCLRTHSWSYPISVVLELNFVRINPLKWKLILILLKDLVSTAKITPRFTIAQSGWLVLFREIIVVCFGNRMK